MLTREQEEEISNKAQLLASAVVDRANDGRLFRDIAALLAMQAIAPNDGGTPHTIAYGAFNIADAMLAERNKRG